MSEPPRQITLPPTFNHDRCGQLSEQLSACRGFPVQVDAAQVHRLGALAAQLLLVAQRTWAHDVIAFKIESPSAGFSDSLRRLGLASAMLPTGKHP
jgi:chemotaxis protein CheX